MVDQETVWGIHAGKTSQGDALFLKKDYMAIGWDKAGDLSQIPKDRESFKAHFQKTYPEANPAAVPVQAGVLYRFVHEIQAGDLVVYPSKLDRHVHIGTIQGQYEFLPLLDSSYPHVRKVKWEKSIARTEFTQGALNEIGSALTLFSVKNYADEFISFYTGNAQPHEAEPDEDETLPHVVEVTRQNTKDYVVKRLSQQLKGHPFAHFVAHLLEQMGYQTRVSPEGPDGGIDIIAHKDDLGFEPPIVKVQVKSTQDSIGDPTVSALYGKVGVGEYGLFVTLGPFTSSAKKFALGKSNLRLIDGEELVDLIFQYYEEFDSKYKGLLRLTQVYIPDTLEED